ncbi:carbohydrate ABC transporter permease [Micromonospora sp. NPDC023966]|uniref:carbohydrate ABC transporter permease n=1 Tax=Micromonospora sp. NPDC023966 TaxID=3154699 RepID=UPI0033D140B9
MPLVVMLSFFVFPFLVMVITGFKTPADIFHSPPKFWPTDWTTENYAAAGDALPVGRYMLNTCIVTGLCVLGTLISCPLVAYSLSKVQWPGRKVLFGLVLATMMLPPQVTMIPVYIMWSRLGATNSYWPLVLPSFLGTPYLIFMVRQFMMGIPDELLEAARVDGASHWRIYRSVVLPLCRPALVTAGVFQLVWTWSDFLGPLLYLNDPDKYTLSVGLYAFFSEHDVAWGPLMSACVIFTLPALGIFLLGQRFFMSQMTAGALK